MSNLAQRVLSAVVLLPILAAVVWLGGWWVSGAVLVAAVLALRELYAMLVAGGHHPRPIGYLVAAALVGAAVAEVRWGWHLLPAVLTLAIIATLAGEVLRRDHAGALLNWVLTLGGALYVAWLLAHFVFLRGLAQPLGPAPLAGLFHDAGAAWIVLALAIVFVCDSGAYFVGRTFGRHRMAPVVSPKKSWEGAAGGLVAAVLAALACRWLLGLPLGWAWTVVLGVVGSTVGQIGDLAESLIKRQVGVKDSGTLIPGHGGVLDRVDSLLFTVPVLYYCILWLTR